MGTTWILARGKERGIEGFSSQTTDRLAGVWKQWTKADAELDTVLGWCNVEGSSEVMVVSDAPSGGGRRNSRGILYDGGQSSEQPAHGV